MKNLKKAISYLMLALAATQSFAYARLSSRYDNTRRQNQVTNSDVHLADETNTASHYGISSIFSVGTLLSRRHFMETAVYTDWPYGNAKTPDNVFRGHTRRELRGVGSAGVRLNPDKKVPVELGYRFFWLGQGYVSQHNPALVNHLNSEESYAQALILTISV